MQRQYSGQISVLEARYVWTAGLMLWSFRIYFKGLGWIRGRVDARGKGQMASVGHLFERMSLGTYNAGKVSERQV